MVDSRSVGWKAGMKDHWGLGISPLRAAAPITHWLVLCPEIWEMRNCDTSLPLWVLPKLESIEMSQTEIRTSDFVLGSYDNGLQFAELWFNLESWSSSVAFPELNLWSSPRRVGLRAEQTLIQISRVTFLHTQARSFTQGCLQHGNRNTSEHTGMARE